MTHEERGTRSPRRPRWYTASPRWNQRRTTNRETGTVARNLPTCGKRTCPFPHSVNNYLGDLARNRTLRSCCQSMLFVLSKGFFRWKTHFGLRLFSAPDARFIQRQRSTAFHQNTFIHSSRQVFAHCRLLHQRAPNCASS